MPEDQPIRPRFIVKKSRIRGGEEEPDETIIPEKVIYVELDDEITMVFDQIKRSRARTLALVIPRRATILQSIVNLKILKKKVDEFGKQIILVTTDQPGRVLAAKAGIPAAKRLANFDEEIKFPGKSMPKTLSGVSERPVRVPGKKISITEVIRQEKPTLLSSVLNRVREKLKKRKSEEMRLVFIAPNKQAIFTLILVSVLLLLAIAYIALPGATVIITPKSSVLDPSFNVAFLDFEKNRDLIESEALNTIVIPTFPIDPPPFSKKFAYNATGKIFRGSNARGIIKITNLSTNPWELAASTRFQTDDGLVFRTPNALRVPALSGNTPGILEARVSADPTDANGQIIGDRGNIGPTKFFLPGLKTEESRRKLSAKSETPMTGGITEFIKVVTKQDIEAAKEFAKREITKQAADDLKAFLEQQNLIKKTNLSLLADRHAIIISEPSIIIPDDLANKPAEQFEVTAAYDLSSISYDREQLFTALKERLVNRADPDKKIVKIAEDDVGYKFLDEDKNQGKLRFTVTMRAIQVYELDPEKENGSRFIKKITDHIAGLRVKDALIYLQQQTNEIANVEIKTWPVWAPTIPNIADNIKFEIVEENALKL